MPKVGAIILNGVFYAGWQAMPNHGITMDEKRRKEDLALDSMRKLIKVAEDNGAYYCCEVVNRFEQYLLNTTKEGVEFGPDGDLFIVDNAGSSGRHHAGRQPEVLCSHRW